MRCADALLLRNGGGWIFAVIQHVGEDRVIIETQSRAIGWVPREIAESGIALLKNSAQEIATR